jgi:hypothetical protein
MMTTKSVPYSEDKLFVSNKQRTFRGRNLLQIAMPLGGIGAGCISFNGQGGLQDFSIRNIPAVSALPDGHRPIDSAFAALYIPSTGVARMVEGQCRLSGFMTRV